MRAACRSANATTVAGALVAVALLGGCSGLDGGGPPSATASPAASAASRDLDVLLSHLEEIHPEPFHGISRAEFVAALRDLQGRLPGLDPDEATVEVMRLVAGVSSSTAA